MRRLTASALLAVTLSVTACGTTVPLSQAAGNGSTSGAGGELGQPGTSGGAATSGPASPGAGTSGGGASGSTSTGIGSTGGLPVGTSGSSATGVTAGPVVQGRGVTSKTLTIGIAIATGTEAAASALGISGAGAVAEQDMWDAVVADVNRSGGVLGRKLVVYTHPVDLGKFVANPQQTYAEVCSDFRDDHKVFTALITISDRALRSCFAKMGTPFVVYGANVSSILPAAAFRENGGNFLYVPGGTTQERLAELFVQSLVERSFMSKWDTVNGGPGVAPVKLGLIHADTPDQHLLYAAYKRELAKHGMSFADTVTYSGDVSTALAATQAAVLKFSSEGITHVFGASAFFLQYAESQHYRPRYAYLPGLGQFGAANSPAAQMKGAMTIGWAPAQDVNAQQDPGDTASAARCRAVMKAHGVGAGNRQDVKLKYAVCDAVYSFRAALTVGREPSIQGLRRGYEGLGKGFAPALTFGATLGPNRHYGVDSMRDMAYDTGCSCLVYTSRTNRS